MADNQRGIPFSTKDEGIDFPAMAKDLVYHQSRRLGEAVNPEDVYVVWFSFVLGNCKALCSTSVPDGRYYEVTYKSETNQVFVDTYIKTNNDIVNI